MLQHNARIQHIEAAEPGHVTDLAEVTEVDVADAVQTRILLRHMQVRSRNIHPNHLLEARRQWHGNAANPATKFRAATQIAARHASPIICILVTTRLISSISNR